MPALAVALFVTEYAPGWLGQIVAYLADLLAAVPSVVYGLWGIFVLVPAVREVELAVYLWAAETAPWLLQIGAGGEVYAVRQGGQVLRTYSPVGDLLASQDLYAPVQGLTLLPRPVPVPAGVL